MFQENEFTRVDGRYLIFKRWKNLLHHSIAKVEVYTCKMNLPNCTRYGNIYTQRPAFIEKALQTQQPANSDQYRCVGLVVSFDVQHSVWITLPCDMKFSATFYCEDITKSRLLSQNVSFPNVSTSFHLRWRDGHVILNKPSIYCPFPWLPGQKECFILQPAKRPQQISSTWLSHKCDLLNASVFIYPNIIWEGYTDILTAEDRLIMAAAVETKRLGFNKVLIMKSENPGYCVFYHADPTVYESYQCMAKDTGGLPALLHIFCVMDSFPGEMLTYNMISIYTCNRTDVIISGSFLCDGIMQCEYGDDEINCTSHNVLATDCSPFSLQMHKDTECFKCPEFYIACGNGDCVPQDALCNRFSDCEDGWDEQICVVTHSQLSFDIKPNPNPILKQCADNSFYDAEYQCIFEHDDKNMLHCSDGSHLHKCETIECASAFKCQLTYCIPLRQMCDGMIDCPTGEDEVHCDFLQCTGLFQCRQSAACLPPWDICDGIVHCKDFLDDEIYCTPCPYGMRCHSNAAVCTNNTDSGMHIIKSQSWIKVLHCHHKASLQALSVVEWHTLTYLDVQHSEISHLDFDLLFPDMNALSYLNAAFNRIVSIRAKSIRLVKILNLSHNMIAILTEFGLSLFPDLVTLILHHNDISVIQRWAFSGLDSLSSVDISHNRLTVHEVSDLPQSMFLENVQSDMLALCCLLSHVPHCTPLASLFSSCENLLHLTVHRVLITGQAVFTLLANTAVLIFRHHLNKKEKFQMIHLAVSNLLMSVYLAMMTGADIYYRNWFASIAVSWTYFSLCKMAASANMIASETSLSLLVFIFIFRAYSMHNVWYTISSKFRNIVCIAIWTVWVVYTSTVVGLLTLSDSPVENNICILVYLIDAKRSLLVLVHSVVYVAVNMLKVTFLIISYGFIACRVLWRNHGSQTVLEIRVKRNRKLATKLFIMFFFNICCWIPIISSVILSLIGVELPDDVAVWMAIIVVPINASFCPIMYCLLPMLVNPIRKKRTHHSNNIKLHPVKRAV